MISTFSAPSQAYLARLLKVLNMTMKMSYHRQLAKLLNVPKFAPLFDQEFFHGHSKGNWLHILSLKDFKGTGVPATRAFFNALFLQGFTNGFHSMLLLSLNIGSSFIYQYFAIFQFLVWISYLLISFDIFVMTVYMPLCSFQSQVSQLPVSQGDFDCE